MLEEWFFELQRLKNEGLNKGAEKGYTLAVNVGEIYRHLQDEYDEVEKLWEMSVIPTKKFLKELADLSNLCDLLFEKIFKRGIEISEVLCLAQMWRRKENKK